MTKEIMTKEDERRYGISEQQLKDFLDSELYLKIGKCKMAISMLEDLQDFVNDDTRKRINQIKYILKHGKDE